MILNPPKNVITTYVINYYKDMEMADEIEYSSSFDDYGKALKEYTEGVQKANKEYFVELMLEIEVEYKDKAETHEIQLAHNASE